MSSTKVPPYRQAKIYDIKVSEYSSTPVAIGFKPCYDLAGGAPENETESSPNVVIDVTDCQFAHQADLKLYKVD